MTNLADNQPNERPASKQASSGQEPIALDKLKTIINDHWLENGLHTQAYPICPECLRQHQALITEARLDEVRVGSDQHNLMTRAERIAWSNNRIKQLKKELSK